MTLAGWHFEVNHLLIPKSGFGADECEDALSVNHARGRFAVADGATEAFGARDWARRLASGWVHYDDGDDKDVGAPLDRADFRRWVEAQGAALHKAWEGRALSWYAEEKARRGSFAAFVGLQFDSHPRDETRLAWRALALGDSCLIVVRGGEADGEGGELRFAFPLSDPAAFNSCPQLVPSLARQQEAAFAGVVCAAGELAAGDVCWLFSDALAAWYLGAHRRNEAALLAEFESLLVRAGRDNLTELLGAQRRDGKLRDDDYAAVRIAVDDRHRKRS